MGHRKQDEERIMAALERARTNYSEGSRAVGVISELGDLIDDIRHEVSTEVREAALVAMNRTENSYMTSEKLRRLVKGTSELPSDKQGGDNA